MLTGGQKIILNERETTFYRVSKETFWLKVILSLILEALAGYPSVESSYYFT